METLSPQSVVLTAGHCCCGESSGSCPRVAHCVVVSLPQVGCSGGFVGVIRCWLCARLCVFPPPLVQRSRRSAGPCCCPLPPPRPPARLRWFRFPRVLCVRDWVALLCAVVCLALPVCCFGSRPRHSCPEACLCLRCPASPLVPAFRSACWFGVPTFNFHPTDARALRVVLLLSLPVCWWFSHACAAGLRLSGAYTPR